MAFHPRKLLFTEAFNPDKIPRFEKKYVSSYLCYSGCPKECNQYFPPPPEKHEMSIILVLMLCVLGIVFFFLFYLTIFKYRSIVRTSRRRPIVRQDEDFRHDEDQRSVIDHPIWYIRTIGLPKTVIDSISIFNYKKGEGLIEGSECSVCLNEFQENESLRLLPKCSHAFHVPCIDTWLSAHTNCPVCRSPIVISNNNDSSVSLQDSSSSSLESRVDNQIERSEPRRGVGFDGGSRVLSDLVDNRVTFDRKLEIKRRSVSMDFGSMIYYRNLEIVEKLDSNVIAKRVSRNSSICRLMKSSSYRCLLQKRPILMKRSFSFSGMRKHSRSQESIQALWGIHSNV